MLYELRELNFYEICRTEEMESPMPSVERDDDRKYRVIVIQIVSMLQGEIRK